MTQERLKLFERDIFERRLRIDGDERFREEIRITFEGDLPRIVSAGAQMNFGRILISP